MKQLSHTIVAILAISLVLVLFAGCGNASTNGQNSAQPYAGVHLTISRWSGPDADAMKTLLPEFTKETGIQVTMDAITYDNLQQKQVLDFSTHTGNYDLVWVPEVWLPEYARAGWLQPIQQYVNDPSLNKPDFDFTDFVPAILQTGKYWNWAINKDTKNPKAAYLLLAYFTSKEVAHQLAVLDGSICARASLFNAPDLVAKGPWLPAVLGALKNAKTEPLVPQSAQISQIMQRQIALVSSGDASPQQALNAANQQIVQAINQNQ